MHIKPHIANRKAAEAVMLARIEAELKEIENSPRCFFCGRLQKHCITLSRQFLEKLTCDICERTLHIMHSKNGLPFNVDSIDEDVFIRFVASKLKKGTIPFARF